jgi:peptidoglycan-associated lipoprotein
MLDLTTGVVKFDSCPKEEIMSYRFLILVLIAPMLAIACAKKTPAHEDSAHVAVPKPAVEKKLTPDPQTTPEAVARIVENLARVHFPFNSEMMTEDSLEALRENARILIAHPSIIVEVQGHCDERGTTEYNLALGQRRAEAVRKYLVRSGVPASHVRTLSLGKETPFATGEGETVWAQNRRVEFRVSSANDVSAVRGTTR